MKRFSRYYYTILPVLIILLSGQFVNAARTRPVDKIKYPPLNKFQLPGISESRTGNGIEIRLIKDETLPIIDIYIILKGGDAYDPPGKTALASVTARLMRIGGAADLTPGNLDRFLDGKGIGIGVSTDTDYILVNLSCLKDNLDDAFSVLAKIMRSPVFDEQKLKEIKAQLGSAVSRRNDNPEAINNREFNSLIYGKDSSFAAVLEHEHIENITPQDIRLYHRVFFAPGNMLAGVSGPVELEEVRAAFEKYFGDWSHKARVPPFPQFKEPGRDFKVAFAEKSTLNQSYITIGHLGLRDGQLDVREKAGIKLFNTIFSQGFTSRLVSRVRVKMGLTYSIGGGIGTAHLYPGVTSFSTFTKSESTLDALRAIMEEIEIIRKEKVTQQELKDARDYFMNSYVFQFGSPRQILLNHLVKEFYGLPGDYEQRLLEAIKQVTPEDLLETANKYLHPGKMVIFVLGKEAAIPGKLSELGKVKKIDISIPPPPVKEVIPAPTPEALREGAALMERLARDTYKGYKGLKSLEITADTVMNLGGRSVPMKIKSIDLYPGKSYTEMSVMGMKMEYLVNGDAGVVRQMGQTRPMPKEEVVKSRFGDLYDIFNSRDKYRFQYLGEKEIDSRKYHLVYIFDVQKNWVKFYINRDTRLIEIVERVSNFPGLAGVAREVHSGFKVVSGIPFAYKSSAFVKDQKAQDVTVKQVEVNPPVDSSLFDLSPGKDAKN